MGGHRNYEPKRALRDYLVACQGRTLTVSERTPKGAAKAVFAAAYHWGTYAVEILSPRRSHWIVRCDGRRVSAVEVDCVDRL